MKTATIIRILLCALVLPFSLYGAKVVPVDGQGEGEASTNYTSVIPTTDLKSMMKSQQMTASGKMLPKEAMDALKSADAAAGRGKWFVAIRQIQTALEAAPNSPVVLEKAALIYRLNGRHDRALACWDRLMENHPEDARLLYERSLTLLRLNRVEEALTHLRTLYAAGPATPPVKYLVIVAQYANDKAGRVESELEQLTLDERAYAASRLADEQAWLVDLITAERYAQLAARVMTWTQPAATEVDLPESELAELSDRLRSQSAALFRLEASVHKRDFSQAADALKSIRTKGIQDPSLRAYDAIIRAATEDGDPSPILRDLQELTRQHSDRADILHYCGIAYLEVGESSEAVGVLQRAGKLEPDNVDVRLGLVAALLDNGSGSHAWVELEALAKRFPESVKGWLHSSGERMERMRTDSRYSELLQKIQ